jgi:hypothetical protein
VILSQSWSHAIFKDSTVVTIDRTAHVLRVYPDRDIKLLTTVSAKQSTNRE